MVETSDVSVEMHSLGAIKVRANAAYIEKHGIKIALKKGLAN